MILTFLLLTLENYTPKGIKKIIIINIHNVHTVSTWLNLRRRQSLSGEDDSSHYGGDLCRQLHYTALGSLAMTITMIKR